MEERRVTVPEIIAILQTLSNTDTPTVFDDARQSLKFVSGDGVEETLFFPMSFPPLVPGTPLSLIAQISKIQLNFAIVLIQAGAASIGHVENGELVRHKMVKKYMVRKKQGKSQIKHLATKGKSREGSRLRLQNTVLFFEEINEVLTDWNVTENSETILMSLPINMKHLLYSSKVPVPFDRKDPRIRKVPVDVRVPSFKELQHIHWLACRGTLK